MELKKIYNEPLKLGEGPIWDPRTQKLFFVDILNGMLYQYDYQTLTTNSYHFEEFISCIALTSNTDQILIALESGIYHFNLSTQSKSFISQPETSDNYRFNDGAVTAWGTWLLGSMNNLNNGENAPLLPDATLFEIYKNQSNPILENVIISNGIAFQGSNIYFIDSGFNTIRKFKYQNGKLGEEKLIFQYEGEGLLDGMCISKSNKLYIAVCGGSKILVFDLDTEKISTEIRMNSRKPTSCTFGGLNMNELFITTSYHEQDDKQECAGLYSIEIEDYGYEENVIAW